MNIEASGENQDRRRGLLAHRQEAQQKAIRQEFYHSDRVRQFHRALLQSETLNDRANQAVTDGKINRATNEETKKMIDEIKQKWLEGIEQDRQNLRKREMEAKAVGDFIKQQMMEHERMRRQMMLDKEREIEACRILREREAREAQMRKQQDCIDKTNARKAHRDLMAATCAIRALEAEKQEMEAERRRFFEMERDQRVMRKLEKKAEKRRAAQRYKKMVVEQLATEMQEKAGENERLNGKMLADSIASWEAKLSAEQTALREKNEAMQDAIAAHRQAKLQEREQRVKEDEEGAQEELNAKKEEDRAYWEEEEQRAQEKEKERGDLDDFLRRQVLERRFRDRLLRGEQLDFDKKYEELISEEEEQFQRYTAAVIDAAASSGRNIIPLLRATSHGMWCGLGPINGGLRTAFLVPGANYDRIPDYVGTTAADIKRLYENVDGQADSRRLGFIW